MPPLWFCQEFLADLDQIKRESHKGLPFFVSRGRGWSEFCRKPG